MKWRSVMDEEKNLEVKEAVPDCNKRYTFADYMTWDDDKRWEIIDGVPFLMSAPTVQHQRISGEIYGQLWAFLKGKPCEVFHAPFDVRLNANTTDDTVVQPDIVVICDKSIMMKTGCQAAPDMVIEILSPSNRARDMVLKLELYQRTGIREYWVVDPEEKIVLLYIMDNGRYYVKPYKETDTAPVYILEGCTINLADVFAE